MAALEDSPTRCRGQSWTLWAQRAGFNATSGDGEEETEQKGKREGDAMKLRKEDMALFGFCPAQDEFYLVVCEMCNQVVKPQALKTHIELRHSGYSRLDGSGGSSQLSGVPGKSPGKDSSHRHSHHSSAPPGDRSTTGTLGGGRSSSGTGGTSGGGGNGNNQCLITKNAHTPHHNRSGSSASSANSSSANSKKNHSITSTPVVRVERISPGSLISTKKQQQAAAVAAGQASPAVPGVMGPPSSPAATAIHSDKRELPSPQQPPPAPDPGSSVTPVSSVTPAITVAATVTSTTTTSVHHGHVMLTSPLGTLVSGRVHHPATTGSVMVATANATAVTATATNPSSAVVVSTPTTVTQPTFHKPSVPPAASGSAGGSNSATPTIPSTAAVSVVSSSTTTTPLVSALHHRLPSGGDVKPTKMGKSKVPKERKNLPCKDRVYDPDKHCGVLVQESMSQCTRSLTCKAHSLALRRNVTGRKKHFDELLADHRATKEGGKSLKASRGAKSKTTESGGSGGGSGEGAAVVPSVSGSSLSSLPGSSLAKSAGQGTVRVNGIGTLSSSEATSGSGGGVGGGSVESTNSSLVKSKTSIPRTSSTSSLTSRSHQSLLLLQASPDALQRLAIEQSLLLASVTAASVAKEDTGFLSHHPRPAAVCAYGARRMGMGMFVYDRRMDSIRSVLRNTLVGDRISQPPPVKKLCVESKLPPVPEPSDPSDPYCFSVGSSGGGGGGVEQRDSPHHQQFSPIHRHQHLQSPPSVVASAASTLPSHSHASTCPEPKPSHSSPNSSSLSKSTASSRTNATATGRPSAAKCRPSREPSGNSNNSGGVNHVGGGGGGGGGGGSTGRTSGCDTPLRTVASEVAGEVRPPAAPTASTTTNKRKRGSSGVTGRGGVKSSPSSSPHSTSLGGQITSLAAVAASAKNGTVLLLPTTCSPATTPTHHPHNNHVGPLPATATNLKELISEVVNGQLGGHHSVTAGPLRTASPASSGSAVRGSSHAQGQSGGSGGGATAVGLTSLSRLAGGLLPRASSAIATSCSLSPSSSPSSVVAATSVSSTARSAGGRRATKGSATKSTSSSSSSSGRSTAPSSSAGHKWNVVNNTVLTGLGALSNASLLAASNNHVGGTTLGGSGCLSPPHLAMTSNFKTGPISSLLPSPTPFPNGLGPSHQSTHSSSSVQKKLTNHVLPTNTATYSISSGSHISLTDNSSSYVANCDPGSHRGKGSKQNSSLKNSSGQRSVQQQHHHHATSLPTMQASTGGFATLSSSAVLTNAGIGHLRLSSGGGGSSGAPGGRNAASHRLLPSPLGSMPASIPIKVLGPSQSSGSAASAAAASGSNERSQQQHVKSCVGSIDELRHASEMQGTNAASFLPT